jgi:Superfamily I DNA and RNA helicases
MDFISKNKSMLIAPAGYGKTYTIAQCLQFATGRSLVLTHTNAGISALKEKFKNQGIDTAAYHIETISSYAQKFALSHIKKAKIPSQENSGQYYPFLIKRATDIIEKKVIGDIISLSYTHLFVDEYQDCTLSQHKLILTLSKYLKTHILGDPLQGIFNFSAQDPIVNMLDAELMGHFFENKYELKKPWRWINSGCENLGFDLASIRTQINNIRNPYALRNFKSIQLFSYNDGEVGKMNLFINTILNNEQNVLFIHPQSNSTAPRVDYVRKLNNRVLMLESLDDKIFYALARSADSITPIILLTGIVPICNELYGVTKTSMWIKADRLVNKRGDDISKGEKLKTLYNECVSCFNLSNVANIIEFFKDEIGFSIARKDLAHSLLRAMRNAHMNSTSVYEEMCNIRNRMRSSGRKVSRHCIGTTLLTKGLECDCVVLLDAEKFWDSRFCSTKNHLYVALTRGSKKVIVIYHQ